MKSSQLRAMNIQLFEYLFYPWKHILNTYLIHETVLCTKGDTNVNKAFFHTWEINFPTRELKLGSNLSIQSIIILELFNRFIDHEKHSIISTL